MGLDRLSEQPPMAAGWSVGRLGEVCSLIDRNFLWGADGQTRQADLESTFFVISMSPLSCRILCGTVRILSFVTRHTESSSSANEACNVTCLLCERVSLKGTEGGRGGEVDRGRTQKQKKVLADRRQYQDGLKKVGGAL